MENHPVSKSFRPCPPWFPCVPSILAFLVFLDSGSAQHSLPVGLVVMSGSIAASAGFPVTAGFPLPETRGPDRAALRRLAPDGGSEPASGQDLHPSIAGLSPGEWLEADGTRLTAVQPDPLPRGNSGFRSVMGAWSGGAYDDKRERLVVWGGGHGDYSGNEVYALDMATLAWSRLTEPSADVGGVESSGEYPDGAPRSRHTYNYLQYAASMDRFCAFGGGAMYPSGGVRSNKVFCFDFASKAWERKAEIPGTPDVIGAISGYEGESGKVWVHFCGNNAPFMEYDPAADAWVNHQNFNGGWFGYEYTAAIGWDRFVAIGGGSLRVWSLTSPASPPASLAMTGDLDILSASNPGLAFHPPSGNFIAWNGGADLYALDIGARKITRIPPASGNRTLPTRANATGTFGRFRYIASQDAFLVVNEVDQNAFILKAPSFPAATPPSEIRHLSRPGRTPARLPALLAPTPSVPEIQVSRGDAIYRINGARLDKPPFHVDKQGP